jgi:hypothetical protein
MGAKTDREIMPIIEGESNRTIFHDFIFHISYDISHTKYSAISPMKYGAV